VIVRREVRPPYLLGSITDRRGTGVSVTGDSGLAVVEVAPYGPWSPQLGEQTSAALRTCLAGPYPSLIVDLGGLDDPDGVSLEFWLTSWRQARFGDTPVRAVFCLPPAGALSRRLRSLPGPQPRVYAGVAEARAAIAERSAGADRRQVRLEPLPASVRDARALVAEACQAWDRSDLLQDTWLIVSELAANAVEHARTDFVVTVARSGARLHLGVHDCLSHFPGVREPEPAGRPAPLDDRGRGLRLVHAVAEAWGTVPTRDGKTVWATLC
jgi:anti-sigma regulatory factor (Ser/Thr protein kinase)